MQEDVAEQPRPFEERERGTNRKDLEVIIQKRGETGTRLQASPVPHTAHIPKVLVQVMR
jgi:hypothetical protein